MTRCEERGISLGQASVETGNSRGYLSRLFRDKNDIGYSRLQRLCSFLNIAPTDVLSQMSFSSTPTIDEITDYVAGGLDEDGFEALKEHILIYAVPPDDATSLSLLHMGDQSFAASVLSVANPDALQNAVDNFPENARRKLIASYGVAARGTCLISIEELSAKIHGQPEYSLLKYKRVLFPVNDFLGEPAVGIYACPVSKRAK